MSLCGLVLYRKLIRDGDAMIETFNPPIRPKTSEIKTKARLSTNDFGDGYSQDIADGINAADREMTLTWPILTFEQAAEIDAFFSLNIGKSFYFNIPGQPKRSWRCTEWQITNETGMSSMTAMLSEVIL